MGQCKSAISTLNLSYHGKYDEGESNVTNLSATDSLVVGVQPRDDGDLKPLNFIEMNAKLSTNYFPRTKQAASPITTKIVKDDDDDSTRSTVSIIPGSPESFEMGIEVQATVNDSVFIEFQNARSNVNRTIQARKMEDLKEDAEDRTNYDLLLENFHKLKEQVEGTPDKSYHSDSPAAVTNWLIDFSTIPNSNMNDMHDTLAQSQIKVPGTIPTSPRIPAKVSTVEHAPQPALMNYNVTRSPRTQKEEYITPLPPVVSIVELSTSICSDEFVNEKDFEDCDDLSRGKIDDIHRKRDVSPMGNNDSIPCLIEVFSDEQ